MADRKISDLTALTTPAAGDYLPIIDISEPLAANKNKRITIEELLRGAPDGTAGAPGIAFESDPNTGIYSPGADQVAISTGGTGRLFIDASGNVSVGGALQGTGGFSASASRDTYAAGIYTGQITAADTSAYNAGPVAGFGFAYKYDASGSYTVGATIHGIKENATDGNYATALRFTTRVNGSDVAERLRITSAGLVGIGTSSPVAPLHVSGSAVFARLTDTQAYNFGTSGPVFDFTGNDSSGANTLFARLQGSPNNGNPDRGFLNVLTRVNGVNTSTLQVGTGFAADVFIPNGRVGIGTTSPSNTLHVNSGAVGTSTLLESTGSGSYLGIKNSSGQWTLGATTTSFILENSGGTALTVDSSRRVGIGTTSPSDFLHVGTTTTGGNIRIVSSIDGANGQLRLFGADGVEKLQIYSANTAAGVYTGTVPFQFYIANQERARIDSSGRLLVGTSSARSNFSGGGVAPALQLESSSFAGATLSITRAENTNGTSSITLGKTRGANTIVQSDDPLGNIYFEGADGTNLIRGARIAAEVDGTPGANDMPGRLVFSTTADGASSPTERVRITSNGRAVFGGLTTTTGSTTSNILVGTSNSTTGSVGIEGYTTLTTERFHASFVNGNGVVGSISTNGSATAFNTSSDYRLKENVVPLTGAADRLNQLQVHRFNFIADPDKTVDGFIAHEAQEVVPECVTGTKDQVDVDGNPVYQGIDQSKLVPLLTAALQEALAEIESLKARVTALEP